MSLTLQISRIKKEIAEIKYKIQVLNSIEEKWIESLAKDKIEIQKLESQIAILKGKNCHIKRQKLPY